MQERCKDCEKRTTQLEKFDVLIAKAKAFSIILIVSVIVVGILLVFAYSLFWKEIPGLNEMNLFVSIVIGIVATIVSIVSMLFSFYGLEKTEESERRQGQILQQILELQKDTKRSADAIQTSLQSSDTTFRDIKSTNKSVPADNIDS